MTHGLYNCTRYSVLRSDNVTRFVDSRFFIKQLPLVAVEMPGKDFEFYPTFVDLSVFESTPQYIHRRDVVTPRCIHYRRVKTLRR